MYPCVLYILYIVCIPFRPLHNGQIRVKRVAQILSEFNLSQLNDKSILEITTKLVQGWYQLAKKFVTKNLPFSNGVLEGGEVLSYLPIYLHLIFEILQFEISSLINWIFFLSLKWIFTVCKNQFKLGKKIQLIKLEFSN